MSVQSRLRQASSELEVVAAQTAIPELSQRTKSRPLPGLLICVAFVAAVAFPLLFSDLGDASSVGQCRPNETCTFATIGPGAGSSTIESNTADAILDHINELRKRKTSSRSLPMTTCGPTPDCIPWRWPPAASPIPTLAI